MLSNVSRVWKPDETLALVFEILLEIQLICITQTPAVILSSKIGSKCAQIIFIYLLFNVYQIYFLCCTFSRREMRQKIAMTKSRLNLKEKYGNFVGNFWAGMITITDLQKE